MSDTTRRQLDHLVEQPEPSVDGDWYVVPIEALNAEGYTHIEVHYDHDSDRANDFVLTKGDGAVAR